MSGYPYPTRLKYAKQRVDIEYAVKKKEYIAKGKNPGKLIGFYTRKLMLLYIGETERALYKCGVLLSPLYSGHDLLEDYRAEIAQVSVPVDLGAVPERRKKPHGAKA